MESNREKSAATLSMFSSVSPNEGGMVEAKAEDDQSPEKSGLAYICFEALPDVSTDWSSSHSVGVVAGHQAVRGGKLRRRHFMRASVAGPMYFWRFSHCRWLIVL